MKIRVYSTTNHISTDERVLDKIESMAYEVWDNYRWDELSIDEAVDIVIDHLDDPGIYGLQCGVDYNKQDVIDALDLYRWEQ